MGSATTLVFAAAATGAGFIASDLGRLASKNSSCAGAGCRGTFREPVGVDGTHRGFDLVLEKTHFVFAEAFQQCPASFFTKQGDWTQQFVDEFLGDAVPGAGAQCDALHKPQAPFVYHQVLLAINDALAEQRLEILGRLHEGCRNTVHVPYQQTEYMLELLCIPPGRCLRVITPDDRQPFGRRHHLRTADNSSQKTVELGYVQNGSI